MTEAPEKIWATSNMAKQLLEINVNAFKERVTPYTRSDLADAAYERGWNEAIEASIERASQCLQEHAAKEGYEKTPRGKAVTFYRGLIGQSVRKLQKKTEGDN